MTTSSMISKENDMLDLLRSIAALKNDYLNEQKMIQDAKATKYDKATIALTIDDGDGWSINMRKLPLRCVQLTVNNINTGVTARKSRCLDRHYICITAAYENGYFRKDVKELKDIAQSYVNVK